MKLIVGLGNLGEKYNKSRHNVGFLVADRLQTTDYGTKWDENKKLKALVGRLKSVDCILAKPTTMMNESGEAVSLLYTFYKIHNTNLFVVHDDLDIALGEYKIQFGKGPKVHNGIKSIDKALGTSEYWRVRIGIENRGKKFPISNFKFPINLENSNLLNKSKTRISNIEPQISNYPSGEDYVLQDFTGEERIVLDKVIEKVFKDLIGRLEVGK